MTSLSLLAGMTVKVDREHYPLIIAVRLNHYSVDFIFLSFGIIGFIMELWTY